MNREYFASGDCLALSAEAYGIVVGLLAVWGLTLLVVPLLREVWRWWRGEPRCLEQHAVG